MNNTDIRPWNYVTPPSPVEKKGLHGLTKAALTERGLMNGPLKGKANIAATITGFLNPFSKAKLYPYATGTPARNVLKRINHLRGIPSAARNMVTRRFRRIQREENEIREKESRLQRKYDYEQAALSKALKGLQEVQREEDKLAEQAAMLKKKADLKSALEYLEAHKRKQNHRNAARTRKGKKHLDNKL